MNNTDKHFSGELKDYRQPMITSLGIIMGFLLNFLASWATSDDEHPAIQSIADGLVAGTLLVAIAGMLVVVYRLLNNRIAGLEGDKLREGAYYQTTFKMYMLSVGLAFLGILSALLV